MSPIKITSYFILDSSAIFFVTCNSSIQQLQLIDRRLRSSGNNLVLESDVVKAIDGDLLDNMLYWIDENDQVRVSVNQVLCLGYSLTGCRG